MELRGHGELVYVSDFLSDEVLAFPASETAKNPAPVYTIHLNGSTGSPQGLWVDRYGILYVADGNVLEFKPGSETPFRTITNGVIDAVTVAVDSSGTLYVGNNGGQNGITVGEYPPGSTKPSLTVTISEPNTVKSFAGAMTFDSAGNLYIGAHFYQKPGTHYFEVLHGTTNYTDLGLNCGAGADGLAMDRGGNLYTGSNGTICVFPPGQKNFSRVIHNNGQLQSFFAVTRSGALYVPITITSDSSLEEYAPGGSAPVNVLSGHFQEPVGAALRGEAF
jgi:hypothetical protein